MRLSYYESTEHYRPLVQFDHDQIREIIEESDKFLQEMEGQLKRNKNG